MYQQSAYGYYPNNMSLGASRTLTAQSLGLKGRPVSSLDEVRATSIDFDGSIFYFPDLSNQKIYTKQINMDGTATLRVYELSELPNVTSETTLNTNENLVTRDEFQKVVNSLTEEISILKSFLTNKGEGIQSAENNTSYKF